MISRFLIPDSFFQFVSLFLIVALLSPIVVMAEVKGISTPPAAIVMPEIVSAPPEPFERHEAGAVGSSLLSVLSVWDDISSWFSAKSEIPQETDLESNSSAQTGTYNAVNDFSTSVNPSGVWSYGHKTSPTAFVSYTNNGQPVTGISSWSPNAGGGCCTWIAKNTTGITQTYYGVLVHPADLLNLHPGPNNEKATVRWTAPASGSYQLQGRFQGIDSNGTSSDGNILKNGTSIWANNINGYGSVATFNLTVSVTAGDVIDFSVGYGTNGSYYSDSTGFTVNISPPSQGASNLSRLRLSPKNQTGGTNLYSRNFGWGTGLAGLSGRGLDAGFGISYNSLMWLKDGSNIVFNPNNDNVSPGFRFGFPVVEPQYLDSLTSKNTFLMVTPSGSRVEFRQVDGSPDTFETADSSYIQLKKVDANNLTITGTDGTNAYYQLKNGAFYSASVKDANGNFITINHDNNGRLQTVTDTLGRVINVNYDAGGQPISITQARSTGTYTFATLSYTNTTISPNFSGLNLVGVTNGATIKVLQKITYSDNSYTQFEHNAFGQVWWLKNHAPDGHQLNYTAINFAAEGQAQTDCPRLALIRNWAENFNLNASGQPQEVSTYINYSESIAFTLPDGTQSNGALAQVVAPNGVHSNNFFGNSGWNEGLPIQTDDYTFDNNAWNRRRWSWTNYTQDNPALTYILNPRVIESKVGDAANTKRTTIEYHTQAGNPAASQWGLVKEVVQYDADQNTPLKKSRIEYNFDTQYTSRRIIGLVADVRLTDQNNALMSRTTFNYDEGNFSEAGQTISPINHDSANYGANYSYRGNPTSTTRWDATDPFNAGKVTTARVKYNVAGNPVSSLDPLNREIKTSYTDSFDDNQNRNTFAYPTQITDPAGNSSTVKYRFDFGANVYAQSPAPAGQSVGKQTSRIYDALGRLEKEIVLNTGAYSRYVYPTNGIQTVVYSTVMPPMKLFPNHLEMEQAELSDHEANIPAASAVGVQQ